MLPLVHHQLQPQQPLQPQPQQQQQSTQAQPAQQQYIQSSTASFSSQQQFDFKNQDKKSINASSKTHNALNAASSQLNLSYGGANKKEIEHFEDFISEEDDDDEEEEDEDEDEEEDDDYDEDDDDLGLLKHQHKKSKKQIDNENDYEIKHNCLTEDGAYMNTLFNSPSSLSSSSTPVLNNNNTNTNNSNSNNSNSNSQHLDSLNRMNNCVKHYQSQMNHHVNFYFSFLLFLYPKNYSK